MAQAATKTPPAKRGVFSIPTPAQVAANTPDSKLTLWEAFPLPGVVLMMGQRGEGKTATAYWVMDKWHSKTNGAISGAVYRAPKPLLRSFRAQGQEWITNPQQIDQLPSDAIIVIDEAELVGHARRSQSAGNLEMANLVALSRQRNQLIILISHHSRKIEVLDLMEASRLIWKRPTEGHIMFERKEMAHFTARALRAFDSIKGDSRKQAYAMDLERLRFGFIPTGKPLWWEESMSTGMRHFTNGR